jgi:hypothetical protein
MRTVPSGVLRAAPEENQNDAAQRFVEMRGSRESMRLLNCLSGDGEFALLNVDTRAAVPRIRKTDWMSPFGMTLVEDGSRAARWSPESPRIVYLAGATRAAVALVHHAIRSTGPDRGTTAIGARENTEVDSPCLARLQPCARKGAHPQGHR